MQNYEIWMNYKYLASRLFTFTVTQNTIPNAIGEIDYNSLAADNFAWINIPTSQQLQLLPKRGIQQLNSICCGRLKAGLI